jgi:hypothetical protein
LQIWDSVIISAMTIAKLYPDPGAIELDENTHRENLTDYATSKARLAEIRQAEADLKAKNAARELFTPAVKNRKRGRPKKPTSKRAVTEVTGVSDTGQRNIERHVEIAERFPFMQRAGWGQHHVLEAGATTGGSVHD